jgi:hypothetical protein
VFNDFGINVMIISSLDGSKISPTEVVKSDCTAANGKNSPFEQFALRHFLN